MSIHRLFLFGCLLVAVFGWGALGCNVTDTHVDNDAANSNAASNDDAGLGSESVTTLPAEGVETTGAMLRGEIEGYEGAEPLEVGFCWHTEDPAEEGSCEVADTGVEDDGEFSYEVDELEMGTEYLYRAFGKMEEPEDATRLYGAHQTFETATASAPTGVEATDGEHESHVVVSWNGIEGVDGYRVLRDGEEVDDVVADGSDTYSIEDDGADAGGAPGAPQNLEVAETVASIGLDWEAADVPPGTEHNYTVVAVREGDTSPPSEGDAGWRAPRPVEGYELRMAVGEQDWGEWGGLGLEGELTHSDYTAPAATIEVDTESASASDGTYLDYVKLEVDEATPQPGDEVSYELRALNQTGPGEVAETTGQRQVGEIIYTWESNGAEIASCEGTRMCEDTNAPENGSYRSYQLTLQADGAEAVVVEDLSGRRAVPELAFEQQPPVEVTAGEAFSANVAVVDQESGDRVKVDGAEISVAPTENSTFGSGDAENTAATDAEGLATFDDLTLHNAGPDMLTATSGELSAAGSSEQFEVVAASVSASTSTISAGSPGVADGVTEATIVVELNDEYGNPVPGASPSFTASGTDSSNGYLACMETNTTGTYNCGMTSTVVGEQTLELLDPVAVTGGTVTFVECAPQRSPFGGGAGTEANPYRICSPDQLITVGNYVQDAFILMNDIDMSGADHAVVGSDEQNPFGGDFDGNGRSISYLTVDQPTQDDVGMFGYVGMQGTIRDLTLADATVTGARRSAGLAATNLGEIDNCHLTGVDVHANGDGVAADAGGLVGYNEGTISDSQVQGVVSGDEQGVGGLAGRNNGGTITNSSFDGDVSLSGYYRDIGGLVGYCGNGSTITDSYSSGSVETPSIGEGDRVGGLVGNNDGTSSTIEYSHSSSSVQGGEVVGGLVGQNAGGIIDSYATETVDGTVHVGGLVGTNLGDITDSYATGYISAIEDVGGLVGLNHESVNSSHATGTVLGDDDIGGLVGRDRGTITNCYATGDVDGGDNVGGLVGRQQFEDIVDCYATGYIAADQRLGGLAGENEATITTSYATGTVYGSAGSTYVGGFVGSNGAGTVRDSYALGSVQGNEYVGGLVGYNNEQGYGGEVQRSYSTGQVDGSIDAGGLVGYDDGGSGGTSASYWDADTSGMTTSAGGTSLTTSEFSNQANFGGWNFSSTWTIGTTPIPDENERPILQWQP